MTLPAPSVAAPATTDSTLPSARFAEAVAAGALVVDIRSVAQRGQQGILPGALAVEAAHATELLDPHGPRPLAALGRCAGVVLVSDDGFDAQLFTWELHARGVTGVRALDGGFTALAAAGGLRLLADAEHVRRERAAITAH